MHTDDDVTSLHTVTQPEQKLGAHFSLVVKSWHEVLPLAQQLVQPAVKPRHLRTLLGWLAAHHGALRSIKGATGGADAVMSDPYAVPVIHVSEDSGLAAEEASRTSLAQLVSACSESPHTRELVARIVRVAAAEAELSAWLASIQERLQGLRLQYSGARSWGAFTPTNLPAVCAGVAALAQELAAVQRSAYHGGVLEAHERVEQLVTWVGATMQVGTGEGGEGEAMRHVAQA